MDEKLKAHLSKLQTRAVLSTIALLIAIIVFPFVFVPSYWAILIIAIFVLCIGYMIYVNRIAKKECKTITYKPVTFHSNQTLSFDKLCEIFNQLSDKDDRLSLWEDAVFYRINKIFKLRIILYKTSNFNKKIFDKEKNRINKKANNFYKISQWVPMNQIGKLMRFNIICTDNLNGELIHLLSANVEHNLRRAEGIINIVICNNEIIIPPLYGDCEPGEISQYKRTIKFIEQYLINKT